MFKTAWLPRGSFIFILLGLTACSPQLPQTVSLDEVTFWDCNIGPTVMDTPHTTTQHLPNEAAYNVSGTLPILEDTLGEPLETWVVPPLIAHLETRLANSDWTPHFTFQYGVEDVNQQQFTLYFQQWMNDILVEDAQGVVVVSTDGEILSLSGPLTTLSKQEEVPVLTLSDEDAYRQAQAYVQSTFTSFNDELTKGKWVYRYRPTEGDYQLLYRLETDTSYIYVTPEGELNVWHDAKPVLKPVVPIPLRVEEEEYEERPASDSSLVPFEGVVHTNILRIPDIYN